MVAPHLAEWCTFTALLLTPPRPAIDSFRRNSLCLTSEISMGGFNVGTFTVVSMTVSISFHFCQLHQHAQNLGG
jgi:hypothetical protein